MEGRRWSEGLHQAIEAKEGVSIREENVTLATITLQNYFRLYEKLAGMTGTAKTEEKEFVEIYGLNVVEIPTNVEVQRDDQNDYIFKSQGAKFDAVVDDIVERHETGQPVLVGTIAVETSELLAELLKRRGVPHNVLNAKEHEREADIIAQAGRKHAVTIATNMAGRGVDIVLGGNPQHELRKDLHAEGFEEGVELDDELRRRFEDVRPGWQQDHEEIKELGGLYVLATERHEARRIDNQLRGRSGRQGDPGESRFYLSAQDDLVRLFAGDRIHSIMERFKLPDDQPMESGLLSKQIENAQKKVEEQNFVARKNVLKYDDVMNVQRQVIYEQRRRVLEGQDLSDDIRQWIEEVVAFNVANFTDAELPEEWDVAGLVQQMQALYGTDITEEELREEVELSREALAEEFNEDALETYEEREQSFGADPNTGQPVMREIERYVILQVVDTRWREHLENMDYLREGVHLRAMAQKDPLVEYRAEGHAMFEDLGRLIREEVVLMLFHVELAPADFDQLQPVEQAAGAMQYEHEIAAGADVIAAAGGGAVAGAGATAATALADPPLPQQVVNEHRDIGRNDPCWCGSGKKFKKCHGA
jgi:preprotein translocase subunit SecA